MCRLRESQFILGNDLAGGKVLVNPEVTAVLSSGRFDELEQKYPELFSVCAVTRAMAKSWASAPLNKKKWVWLTALWLILVTCHAPVDSSPKTGFSFPVKEPESKVGMSRDQLLIEQKREIRLAPLFEAAESGSEIGAMTTMWLFLTG